MRCTAASLPALCLAACLCGGGCLRNKAGPPGPPAAALELAESSPELREKRVATLQRWIWLALRAGAEYGTSLAPLLFSSGPNSLASVLADAEPEAPPQCGPADGEAVQRFGREKAERWLRTLLDAADPYVMNSTGPLTDMGMRIQVAKSMETTVHKAMKQVSEEMPRSCNLASIARNGQPQFVTCAHQMTNVSKPCIRCSSTLLNSISSNCAHSCFDSMTAVGQKLATEMQPVLRERNAMGTLTPEDMQELSGKIFQVELKVMKAMKVMVPCVKCTRHRVSSFLTCLNADEAMKEDTIAAMKSIEDALHSGNITSGITQPLPRQDPTIPL